MESTKENLRKNKSTKEKVMDVLYLNKGKAVSGEEISEILGISRASVWKHINSLKKEGYIIESKSGSGYTLIGKTGEGLTSYDIKKNLDTAFIGQNVEYFETIDSTNSYAGNIAEKSPEGTVVVSQEQTKGRGRTGRKWISKEGEGIYFSVILKPEIPVVKASFLTQVAGCAIVETLVNMGIDALIKWPNDIILNGKKIAGILTEMRAEIDCISHIIVGIGINISGREFDEEIRKKATSIEKEGYKLDRCEFLQMFFTNFEKRYIEFINGESQGVLEILREKSAVIGKEIYLVNGSEREKAEALDIDENGNLKVKTESGEEKTVFTGEISVRGRDSYI